MLFVSLPVAPLWIAASSELPVCHQIRLVRICVGSFCDERC